MSNAIVSNVAVIRSVRIDNVSQVVNHYHVTLQAARSLRAVYLETIKAEQPPATIKAALDHYNEVWREYLRLCRINGILAAHS